jgi:thermitase
MEDFIYPYREGRLEPVTDGQFFDETGHYVGGAFWNYWRERGGLPIFGYPLTEETEEDGRTVQYFERAVFEYHPENAAPWTVLLRRLGAEALARVMSDE